MAWAPLWDVQQRALGPRASVGFKNPPKQELAVLFEIVFVDEYSWPLTNSPFQEASKIENNFLSFFCLQESLCCSEGAIWCVEMVRAWYVQVLAPLLPKPHPTTGANHGNYFVEVAIAKYA